MTFLLFTFYATALFFAPPFFIIAHLANDESVNVAFQPLPPEAALGDGVCGSSVMCWSHDEVYAGTEGFSPSLRVGEGGFGVVYRASLNNTDCAVKRLKQVSQSQRTQ